jgi:hypothetical protein
MLYDRPIHPEGQQGHRFRQSVRKFSRQPIARMPRFRSRPGLLIQNLGRRYDKTKFVGDRKAAGVSRPARTRGQPIMPTIRMAQVQDQAIRRAIR